MPDIDGSPYSNRNPDPSLNRYRQRVGFLRKHVDLEDRSILVIACGLGWMVQALTENGYDARGIESDEATLRMKDELSPVADRITNGDILKKLVPADIVITEHMFVDDDWALARACRHAARVDVVHIVQHPESFAHLDRSALWTNGHTDKVRTREQGIRIRA